MNSNATSCNGRTRTCLVRLSVSILSKKTSRQNAGGEKRASSKFPASIAVTHSLRLSGGRHRDKISLPFSSDDLLLWRVLCIESMGSISQNRCSTTIHSLFCWRRNGRWMNAVVRPLSDPSAAATHEEGTLSLSSYLRVSLPSTTRRLKPTTVMRSSSMR